MSLNPFLLKRNNSLSYRENSLLNQIDRLSQMNPTVCRELSPKPPPATSFSILLDRLISTFKMHSHSWGKSLKLSAGRLILWPVFCSISCPLPVIVFLTNTEAPKNSWGVSAKGSSGLLHASCSCTDFITTYKYDMMHSIYWISLGCRFCVRRNGPFDDIRWHK